MLADFCEWLPDGSGQPCYAPAALVLVRPSGHTLRFTCAEHSLVMICHRQERPAHCRRDARAA